jgi:hypothetical protein
MSRAKPMTTEERATRYVLQNGSGPLTPAQRRRIRKTELRLEHGRHRKQVNRPKGERASKGRKSLYADWMRG